MKYNYKPSLKELRFSLRHRSKEYLLENTLHGVPYFIDSTRPKWERITWLLLTVASIVATAVVIVVIWGKFQTEPTITGLDIMTEYIDIEFPKIFLCSNWPQLNYSHLHKSEMFMYEELYNWTWEKDVDFESFEAEYKHKNNFRSTFELMAPDCNNLISSCAYRLYFTQSADWSPKPDERPATIVYFSMDIEFIVDVTYTTPDIQYLTLRQRECYFKQEGVTLHNCEVKCLIDKLLVHCNCLPWFLSSTNEKECPISKYSCLNHVSTDTDKCNCWISCDHTSYSIKGVKKSNTNTTRVILRNWPTALYKREMRFGYLDLLVSFGGIASLFLGYSLLTSVELGYYFSLRTYCGAVIESSRKRHIIKIHVVEKYPQKIDINPTYYQYVN
ncbi:uncharacterized protein LOC143185972 [Calliopsis andreniformis]|uniref:uncharacterized protein LOC143185972 n=1 Tax=Calliopsis andreniformis TaxID=337506 RepID=UPI003FCE4A1E